MARARRCAVEAPAAELGFAATYAAAPLLGSALRVAAFVLGALTSSPERYEQAAAALGSALDLEGWRPPRETNFSWKFQSGRQSTSAQPRSSSP